jgi:hypothetical protein
LDIGSTTTFRTPQFATLTASPTTPAKRMEVAVANGQRLWIDFSCLNCPYTIQGTPFTSDFRLLQLKGYDVILGSDWVKQYIPVTLDYKKMTLRITLTDNTTITFRDESLPSSSVIQESVKLHKLLEEATCGAVLFLKPLSMDSPADSSQHPQILQLLDEYSVLFSEPQSLPPKRDCDHTIPLMPEAKIVNQRPYRLPHHQKNVLEDIVKDLLQKGIIRDSTSPYSSPVVLVKKKDHTWRKCTDYRKPNL